MTWFLFKGLKKIVIFILFLFSKLQSLTLKGAKQQSSCLEMLAGTEECTTQYLAGATVREFECLRCRSQP